MQDKIPADIDRDEIGARGENALNTIVVSSLYLIAGIVAYAAVHHFVIAIKPHRNDAQLLFAVMCLLSVLFAVCQVQNLQSDNIADFIRTLRWNLTAVILTLVALPWFIGLYTGKMLRPLMAGLSLLFAVLFFANLMLPYTLQYAHIDRLYTLRLPWGESITRAEGHKGFWSYIAIASVAAEFSYAIYALCAVYRQHRRRADLWMLMAFGLYLLCMGEGILVKWSVIRFFEVGPIGFLATVIVMSVALTSEMQQRLRSSESNFRSLFDNSPTAILAVDSGSLRIVQANDIALEMFGCSPAEILDKSMADLTPADDADSLECREDLDRLSRGLVKRLICEKHFKRRDGSGFIGLASSSTLRDGKGKALRFVHSIIDITERKQAEVALKRESEKNLMLLRNASDGIHILDMAGNVMEVSDSFCAMLGYGRNETIGMNVSQWDVGLQFDQRHHARFETRYRRKDGTLLDVEVSTAPLELDGMPVLFHSARDITKRNRAINALRESEIRFRTIIEQSPIGLALGRDGIIMEANDVFLQMYGYREIGEALGHPLIDHIAPQCRTDVEERVRRRITGEPTESSYETVGLRRNGSEFPVHISVRRVELSDGPLTCAFMIDITERKKAEADLRIAAIAFESHEGILIADSRNVILKVNQSFSSITGYSADEVIGRNPHILSSGLQDADFYAAMWKSLNDAGAWEGEIWNRRKNGEIYAEHLTVTAVKDINGIITNYVAAFTDITESRAAAEKINHLAFYDHLTELPNQKLLLDRLQQALASSSRSGKQGAVLFIDLNDFKSLNDTLGHVTGDALLRQVALRLTACVREGDTVSRFGGDEFVVVLEGLDDEIIEAAEQTEAACSKIFMALNQPYQLAMHEYQCTVSIGATLFRDHLQTIDELLKQADIALYQAKRADRNTLRFFDPKMQEAVDVRTALESELHQSVRNEQFTLHYQVQIDSAGLPIGAEALIRWMHPEKGMVMPSQFIPLAEEIGLILPIGQWVVEAACAQIKAWERDERKRHLALSVNISAKQLHLPDFVDHVSAAIKRYGIDPRLIKLELTESMLLENIEDTISTMSALRKIGLGFSLDDFGTGYSSLQYLKRLPLDQLKIDQSFIRDIVTDGNDQAIVRTIIAMAQSLNLDVIAEGVETEEQRQFLEKIGCTQYQGYFFGKPAKIDEFETALAHFGELKKPILRTSAGPA